MGTVTLNIMNSLKTIVSTKLVIQSRPSDSERSCTTNSNTKKDERRVVSFSVNGRVKRTLHVNDYSDEEYRACWYSRQEMTRMRREVLTIAALMDAGWSSIIPGADSVERSINQMGLENRTSLGQRRLVEIRTLAWDSVFDEQERQRHFGYPTDKQDAIAHAYREFTLDCQIKATLTALFRVNRTINRIRDHAVSCELAGKCPPSLDQQHKLATAAGDYIIRCNNRVNTI